MFDQKQANDEGWCVSQCIGSSYFPDGWMDIQKWNTSDVFENDLAALSFVAFKASVGSEYHIAAIKYYEQENFSLIPK